MKIDLKKELPELYTAGKRAKTVTAKKGGFLWLDGEGSPNDDAFTAAVDHMFGVAYTLRSMLAAEGELDFKVPPLECLWHDEPEVPESEWHWTLLIRVPEAVTASQVTAARKALADQTEDSVPRIKRKSFREGICLQMMHVGPYDTLARAYDALAAAAENQGLVFAGAGHEIYVGDPTRAKPENLKTIVRVPVRKG